MMLDDTLKRLKERLAKEEENLTTNSGKAVIFSPTGPVSMGLVKAMIEVIEEQNKEIIALKSKSPR